MTALLHQFVEIITRAIARWLGTSQICK